jgi:GT2 family glycosyltransferase
MLGDRLAEVIVVDDSSDPPVEEALSGLPSSLKRQMRIVRQERAEGYIVARNTIMRLAATDYVLLLDDDAYLLATERLLDAIASMEAHAEVAAVGCAQAEADGRPWPAGMQPAPVSHRCRVPSYIGFAHLLRRRNFLELGGYPEELHFYGEEKIFCARLLRAGFHVVYMPDLLVAHVPDPGGRSTARYLRYVVRNDCLFALYNLPWPAMCVSLPVRLARYFSMRSASAVRDRAGFLWIVAQLVRAIPRAVKARRPMTWANVSEWRRLRRDAPPWPA